MSPSYVTLTPGAWNFQWPLELPICQAIFKAAGVFRAPAYPPPPSVRRVMPATPDITQNIQAQSQLPLEIISIIGCGGFFIAEENQRVQNSSIYRESLEEWFDEDTLGRLIRPLPPLRPVMIIDGYDPFGGYYIDLQIMRQIKPHIVNEPLVSLPLIVTNRPAGSRGVHLVLGRDYFDARNAGGQLDPTQGAQGISLSSMNTQQSTDNLMFSDMSDSSIAQQSNLPFNYETFENSPYPNLGYPELSQLNQSPELGSMGPGGAGSSSQ
ncbi:hypothetical protein GGS24DRAFT_497903 [Hypoxylon argillaceum]|nr:hypothetical protein GGS24DRAFT_497903 [Hypoxylon argillaceum]